MQTFRNIFLILALLAGLPALIAPPAVARQIILNNVKSKLTAAVGVSDTTITVTAGDGAQFAAATGGDTIRATLVKISGFREIAWEIVDVTGRSSDTLTITRAREGTTALTFSIGDVIDVRFTAGMTLAALSGPATTATALAANGANCSAGSAPLGVDAAGAVESCFVVDTPSSTTTWTNKTYDTAGAGNVLKINGTTVSAVTGTGSVALSASPTFTGTVTAPTINATTDFTKSGGILNVAGAPVTLPNAKYPAIYGACLNTGNNDLYTVPASRKAVIFPQSRAFNASAGSITYYHAIKVSGVYYPLSTPGAISAGVGASNPGHILPIILNAGESFSVVTSTTNCLNVRLTAVEFDDTETRLITSRILSLASGNNTLFTVPIGKSAYILANSLALAATPATGLPVSNFSGGSLNYYINQVPSGGSVGTSNQMIAATAIANQTTTTLPGIGTLAAGEFINVNASAAGGVAFVTYYLLP